MNFPLQTEYLINDSFSKTTKEMEHLKTKNRDVTFDFPQNHWDST